MQNQSSSQGVNIAETGFAAFSDRERTGINMTPMASGPPVNRSNSENVNKITTDVNLPTSNESNVDMQQEEDRSPSINSNSTVSGTINGAAAEDSNSRGRSRTRKATTEVNKRAKSVFSSGREHRSVTREPIRKCATEKPKSQTRGSQTRKSRPPQEEQNLPPENLLPTHMPPGEQGAQP